MKTSSLRRPLGRLLFLLAATFGGLLLVTAARVGAAPDGLHELYLPLASQKQLGAAVTRTIGPAGASFLVTTSDGAAISFDFPPGAVQTATTLTITPQTAAGANWLTLTISPTGIALLEPLALSVTLPEGAAPDATTTLTFETGGESVYLPTEVDAAQRRLTASLPTLGLPPAGDNRAPLQEGTLNVTLASCPDVLNAADAALDALVNAGDYERAIQLLLSISALHNHDACGAGETELWLTEAAGVACLAYNDAVDEAALPVDSYDELYFVVRELIYWHANIALIGGEPACPESAGFLTLIEEKFNQFVLFYENEIDPSNFPALRDEMQQVVKLRAEAAVLGLDTLEQTIIEAIQKPLLDQVRNTAYRECALLGNQTYLAELLSWLEFGVVADFDQGVLRDDIQQCGNSVTVAVEVDGFVVVTDTLGGGLLPTELITETTVTAPVTSTLVISGQVPVLLCPDGQALAEDGLLVRLDDEPVDAALGAAGNLLAAALVIDLGEALSLAGYANPEDATGLLLPLTLIRQSNACDGFYGDTEYPLFTINLDFSTTWLFSMGSDVADGGRGIAVAPDGRVYATGRACGVILAPLIGGCDAWLVAFTPDGGYEWFYNLGTEVYDEGNDVAVDDNGNVYVAGTTDGFFDGSPDDGTYGVLLARYSSAGTEVWIQRLAPLGSDFARGEFVAVAGNGDVIAGGRLDDGGGDDAWVGRYAPDGSEIWVRTQSAAGNVGFRDAHVTPDGIVTVGGQWEPANGGSRARVVQYDADGNVNWTWTRDAIPNGINSWVEGVVVAADGAVYVTGQTNEGRTVGQVWVARLDSSGNLVWLVDAGLVDDFHELGGGAALRPDGVVLAGYSQLDGSDNGNTWFASYSFDGVKLWDHIIDIDALDTADQVAVSPAGNICMTGIRAVDFVPESRDVWIGCASPAGRLGDLDPLGPQLAP